MQANQQFNARICNQDCEQCAMVWFCVKELNTPHICGRQLERIIFAHALKSGCIDIDSNTDLLECSALMKVLAKCKIVIPASEYKYPLESEARKEKIDEAWNGIASIGESERYVMLGRIPEAHAGAGSKCTGSY